MNGILSTGFLKNQKFLLNIALTGKQFEIIKLRPWLLVVKSLFDWEKEVETSDSCLNCKFFHL